MRLKFLFLVLIFYLNPTTVSAQADLLQEKKGNYVVLEDVQGARLEGYLRSYPNEISVSTKDNQEKSIPVKMIESIKVEKIAGRIPGADQMGEESYYSVKLQNSHEILKLDQKYTFSLNTSVGVVTQTIDPEMVPDLFKKGSPAVTGLRSDHSFVRDKNVAFSLEFKF
jgi:hypothetical protein